MKHLFKLLCFFVALVAITPAQNAKAQATVYFINSSKLYYYDITLAIDGKDIKTFDAPFKKDKDNYKTMTIDGVTETIEPRKPYYQKIEMHAGTYSFKIYYSWFAKSYEATKNLEIKDGEVYYLKYGYSMKDIKIDVLDAKKGAKELEKLNKDKNLFVFPEIKL